MKSSTDHLILLSKKEKLVRKQSTIFRWDDVREVSGIYLGKLLLFIVLTKYVRILLNYLNVLNLMCLL